MEKMETSTGTTTQLQPTVSDLVSIDRKNWVLSQYLAGYYPYQIEEKYKAIYKLSEHSFQKDVAWMYSQLRKKGENETEAIIERHTDRYNYLYQLAVDKGDLRSANLALRNLEDLYQLHKGSTGNGSAGSINVQINNNKNSIQLPPMSTDEIRELLGRSSTTVPNTLYIPSTNTSSTDAE